MITAQTINVEALGALIADLEYALVFEHAVVAVPELPDSNPPPEVRFGEEWAWLYDLVEENGALAVPTDLPVLRVASPAAWWELREAAVPTSAADPVGEALNTWQAIADALGVSTKTLARRRSAAKNRGRPDLHSVDEARAWFADLERRAERVEAAPRRGRRSTKASTPDGPVDWSSVEV